MTSISFRPDATALGAADENHQERVGSHGDPLRAVMRAEGAGAKVFHVRERSPAHVAGGGSPSELGRE